MKPHCACLNCEAGMLIFPSVLSRCRVKASWSTGVSITAEPIWTKAEHCHNFWIREEVFLEKIKEWENYFWYSQWGFFFQVQHLLNSTIINLLSTCNLSGCWAQPLCTQENGKNLLSCSNTVGTGVFKTWTHHSFCRFWVFWPSWPIWK